MKRLFHGFSMQQKITILIFSVVLIFLVAMVLSIQYIKDIWREQVMAGVQRKIELSAIDWEKLTSSMESEATALLSDKSVTAYLYQTTSEEGRETEHNNAFHALFNKAVQTSVVKNLCLIVDYDKYVACNLYRNYFSKSFVQRFLSNADMTQSAIKQQYLLFPSTDGARRMLYVKTIFTPAAQNKKAYLLMLIDATAIIADICVQDDEINGVAILNSSYDILFAAPNGFLREEQIALVTTQKSDIQICASHSNTLFRYTFADGGWTIIQSIDERRLLLHVNNMFLCLVCAVVALCIILYVVMRMIFFSYVHRIGALNDTMSRVASGNMRLRHEDDAQDEIAQIGMRLNGMLDRIQRLVIDVSQNETRLREAQLLILRQQISPHFLFNTLETIRMIAVQHEDAQIKELTQDLSDILRYSLDDADSPYTYVGEEIAYLHKYVRIQEARFGGRFDYSFEIDGEIERYRTYKFILQPIVENAFKHSIMKCRHKASLLIRISVQDNQIVFTVFNTGEPFSEKALISLRQYICSGGVPSGVNASLGLGLRNIIDRIRLYYGDRGSVEIDSSSENGTSVTVRFPAIL